MRQTLQEIEGFLYRQELITERQVSSAWMTAAWYRSKRLPTLRSVLNRLKGKRLRESPESKAKIEKADFEKMTAEMTKDLNIKPQE